MAESFVQVAPNSSGLKLHTFELTIGANVVEDEIIRQAPQYLATYACTMTSAGTSIATANDHVIQIMAGASLNVYITRIHVHQLGLATAAAFTSWQILRLTTAGTGGTSLTPLALDSSDPGVGAAGMTLPTVKGTEGSRLWAGSTGLTQTAPTAGQNTRIIDLDFNQLFGKPLRIPAGAANGICLKHITGAAAATALFSVWLYEASF